MFASGSVSCRRLASNARSTCARNLAHHSQNGRRSITSRTPPTTCHCPTTRCNLFRQFSSSAAISSESTQKPADAPLFDSKESAWDHVFSDIKDMPPLIPSRRPSPAQRRQNARRQTMTAREIDAFDDIFNMIFNAVAEQKSLQRRNGERHDVDISKDHGFGSLFGKLRRHSKRLAWTSETDSLLDQKKEAMDLCDTDQQLLEWAMREVFGEKRKEKQESPSGSVAASSTTSSSEPTSQTAEATQAISDQSIFQSPAYPHLIAMLMRAFRDKYRDPNLALSIFDHARHLSIVSYVFGCTTMAYNELIETRWRCFRDIQGVHDALVEMSVNGVDFDNKTLKLIENLRKDVGETSLRQEDDLFGNGDMWSILQKIEDIVAEHNETKASRRDVRPRGARWDDWKSLRLEDDEDDEWGFDRWDTPPQKAR